MARAIPASGINLFQLIYVLIRDYEKASGLKALNLSLGNPDLVPPKRILDLQSRFAADPSFAYHTYAEDNNLHGFAEAMTELHGRIKVAEFDHLKAVPIPGIKTAGALLPLACGLHLPDKKRRISFTIASNLPAYDVIGTWSDSYLGSERIVWPLLGEDGMRPRIERLDVALRDRGLQRVDLVYVIRPGNPASVGATRSEWNALLDWCADKGTRLVNDGAYAGLSDESSHCPLALAAAERRDVEWVEMYSVSKSFSDPGARLGAMAGTRDFIDDFVMIKGNTESGPVPYVMAAYGEFFKDGAAAKSELAALRSLYRKRLDYVIGSFRKAGLRPACETNAGFFTLWKVPQRAFGVSLASDPRTKELPPHEAFNRLTISETGIVGVHFLAPGAGGKKEPLIRYGVCDDVLSKAFQERFEAGLSRMRPEY